MAPQAEGFLWDRDWGLHAGSTHSVNPTARSRVWSLGHILCVLALKTLLQGQRIPGKQWVGHSVQNLTPRVQMGINSISLVMQLPREFFGGELVTMGTLFSPSGIPALSLHAAKSGISHVACMPCRALHQKGENHL